MYFTYLSTTGFCPHIKENVTISGKYKEVDNHTYKLALYTCPILENAKLSPYEQCEEFKYLPPCSNPNECPIAIQFQESITL